jgi:hypothetical protein
MRTLLLSLILIGCGSVQNTLVDAPPVDAPLVDAPPVDTATPDSPTVTPPLALDCATYCTHLANDCTGANLQISTANCMGTCAAFPPGTQADMSGNTLGCRNYHLQNIEVKGMAAATHCPHAGPVGGLIAAGSTEVCGASPCADFCAMHTKVCGTTANPVTGVNNHYADLNTCMTACGTFATTPEASPVVTSGNNFACRIYHLTNAAAATGAGIDTHCGHALGPTATAVCI